MKLSDLLVDEWIAVPLEARDLSEALGVLVDRVARSGALPAERGRKLARDLAFGSEGEVVRVNDEIVLVLGRVEALEAISVTLGVAPAPFSVSAEGETPARRARALILLLTPRSTQALKAEIVPTLVRVLRDPARTRKLLEAGSVVEIRALKELMEAEIQHRLLVEDALVPARYRVYPDTPLSEVIDLIVRRGLRAVPVVGERYEVLGIITSGDALKHLLPRKRPGDTETDAGERPTTARDVMTRSVMCVSEEQSLLEAANLMVNRDVEQLPVVREGELVGFLTRDTILRALFGARTANDS